VIETNKPQSQESAAAPAEQPRQEERPTDLADAATQEKYRQEYLIQMRRLSCPGCGDDGRSY
jgi:hypothetical protein